MSRGANRKFQKYPGGLTGTKGALKGTKQKSWKLHKYPGGLTGTREQSKEPNINHGSSINIQGGLTEIRGASYIHVKGIKQKSEELH